MNVAQNDITPEEALIQEITAVVRQRLSILPKEMQMELLQKQHPRAWFNSGDDSPVTHNIGTQINIGNVNIALSASPNTEIAATSDIPEKRDEAWQDYLERHHPQLWDEEERPNIILGSGDVNPAVLSKIIHSYYNSQQQGQEQWKQEQQQQQQPGKEQTTSTVAGEKIDRRKYKGKHRNSPMIIKLMQRKSARWSIGETKFFLNTGATE